MAAMQLECAEEMDMGEQGCSSPGGVESSPALGYDELASICHMTAGADELDGGNLSTLALMLAKQNATRPNADYLLASTPGCVTAEQRAELVHWVMNAQTMLQLSPLTSALAVNYIDRFFSRFSARPNHPWSLQLAGLGCLSIAAKMEEACPPTLRELQDLPRLPAAETADLSEMAPRMELLVLDSLRWDMNAVTPVSMVDRLLLAADLEGPGLSFADLRTYSRMLLHLAVYDVQLLQWRASVVAGGALLAAVVAMGRDPAPTARRLSQLTEDAPLQIVGAAMALEACRARHAAAAEAAGSSGKAVPADTERYAVSRNAASPLTVMRGPESPGICSSGSAYCDSPTPLGGPSTVSLSPSPSPPGFRGPLQPQAADETEWPLAAPVPRRAGGAPGAPDS